MSLSKEAIEALLKEEQAREASPRSRTKADPTANRTINQWFKLNHHICTPMCEHRANDPTSRACTNPDCADPRPTTDRGVDIVTEVRGQNICRYCFLGGYLT